MRGREGRREGACTGRDEGGKGRKEGRKEVMERKSIIEGKEQRVASVIMMMMIIVIIMILIIIITIIIMIIMCGDICII